VILDTFKQASARILIIDADDIQVNWTKDTLGAAGFGEVMAVADPDEALGLHARWQPELMLLELHLPGQDGFAVLERLRFGVGGAPSCPVIVLTGDRTREARELALACGADDFLLKPVDPPQLLRSVRRLLDGRRARMLPEETATGAGVNVHALSSVDIAQIDLVYRLACAVESRKDALGNHIGRVGQWVELLARALGFTEEHSKEVALAAQLHDIGKVVVPEAILLKPTRLTAEEIAVVRTHTMIGYNMLNAGQTPILRLAAEVALTHHERWDGSGYPHGLARDEIPLAGRLVAVVDVFDALVSKRPHRAALTPEEAAAELRRGRGVAFDPAIVDAYLAIQAEYEALPINQAVQDVLGLSSRTPFGLVARTS